MSYSAVVSWLRAQRTANTLPHLEGIPRIVLDTSILRHAKVRRIVRSTVQKGLRWGDRDVTLQLPEWREELTLDRAAPNLRDEVVCLPLIAHSARRQVVQLEVQAEVLVELGGLPTVRSLPGILHGAPFVTIEAPFYYARILCKPPLVSRRDAQLEFLSRIDDVRFLELQKVTGTNNLGPRHRNQLADAFHIWSAEAAGADYFLTTDLKLVRAAASRRPQRPKLAVVSPTMLLLDLFRSRTIRGNEVLSFLAYTWTKRIRSVGRYRG